jgi:glycosyltransferase involved in cell wall biosynthesis
MIPQPDPVLLTEHVSTRDTRVALLTAGKDRHYVAGLLSAMQNHAVQLDCIGGDEIQAVEALKTPRVVFHNFIRGQEPGRSLREKILGLLGYYRRLAGYAVRADASVFHILWFRRFPQLEGILLTTYLKMLRKRLVFTAHNVDGHARDGTATLWTNIGLRYLYRTVDHILVHTNKMKDELASRFGIEPGRITVVPLGINDAIPVSPLTRKQAKENLGFGPEHKVLLFFGTIARYKGIHHLLKAMASLCDESQQFRLIIAGPAWKGGQDYWRELEETIVSLKLTEYVTTQVAPSYISDEDVAAVFRAADVSVLPYEKIYQSGVLTLSYSQGLPVIAADVGSLAEDVIAGETGLIFRAGDADHLATRIREYFASDLFSRLEDRSDHIREYGERRFSWALNARRTCGVYESLLGVGYERPPRPRTTTVQR